MSLSERAGCRRGRGCVPAPWLVHKEVGELGGQVAQVQLVELDELQQVVELGATSVERVAQLVLLFHLC